MESGVVQDCASYLACLWPKLKRVRFIFPSLGAFFWKKETAAANGDGIADEESDKENDDDHDDDD